MDDLTDSQLLSLVREHNAKVSTAIARDTARDSVKTARALARARERAQPYRDEYELRTRNRLRALSISDLHDLHAKLRTKNNDEYWRWTRTSRVVGPTALSLEISQLSSWIQQEINSRREKV